MNRFSKGNNHDDDDEENLYERQALISDEEYHADDDSSNINSNRFVVRHRTQLDKRTYPHSNGYELKNFNRDRDLQDESTVPTEFTNYDIQSGDTLQSICLRYACPVTQVKRLNGLINDQEFYGLRVLKLPLGKLGLLEDTLRQQQQQTNDDIIDLHDDNINEPKSSPRRFVNSPGSALSIIKNDISDKSSQINVDNLLTDSEPVIESVFQDLDYHVEMAKAAAEIREQRVTELVDTIAINNPTDGTNVVRPATRVSKIPELFFSGENFGLNLKKLIFLIIFVCLVVPLIYLNQTSHIVKYHLENHTVNATQKLSPNEITVNQ